LRIRDSGLDGIFPSRFAGDDIRIDVAKDGSAGAVVVLLVDGKIELPPVG
jgi:hypothetical protein